MNVEEPCCVGSSFLARVNQLDDFLLLSRGEFVATTAHTNAERIAYFLGRKDKEKLSSKTNGDQLDAARQRLLNKVGNLKTIGANHANPAAWA